MGLVKRRVSTSAKMTIENFDESFLLRVKATIEMGKIPSDLIINFDQTAINYMPTTSWTLKKEGSKRVEIKGANDE